MPAYKDKNNKWYVSFRYQDWTGKKVRKVKRGFETRREALEWERRFLLKENGSMDNSLKVNIASICMFFAIFCRCHQTIFFEDFTKIIYVSVSNKFGNFHERIVGV